MKSILSSTAPSNSRGSSTSGTKVSSSVTRSSSSFSFSTSAGKSSSGTASSFSHSSTSIAKTSSSATLTFLSHIFSTSKPGSSSSTKSSFHSVAPSSSSPVCYNPSATTSAHSSTETCLLSMIVCNDTCVDPLLNPNNCLCCGNICDSGICLFGRCFDCPDDSSGEDVCASSTNTDDAFCTDFSTDAQNCGGCGNVCSSGQCAAGTCCISPDIACREVCVNPVNDMDNCGYCDHKCSFPDNFCRGECFECDFEDGYGAMRSLRHWLPVLPRLPE
jgi:hypothetical protein